MPPFLKKKSNEQTTTAKMKIQGRHGACLGHKTNQVEGPGLQRPWHIIPTELLP